MTALRIGCSGWTYEDWAGSFYPREVRARERLAWYAGRFDTTEINGTFYRLPSAKSVAAWAGAVPAGFVFAWKVSRFISHNKKLKDCADSIDLVFGRMKGLGRAEGPALVQLPPGLHRDDERLDGFLKRLPRRTPCAVEFRHRSWYDPAVFDILAAHGAALCISDHHDAPAPWETTANIVYVRLHGPGGRYHGRYPKEELGRLAERITSWRRGRRDVYCYFDNDVKAAAPRDAQALLALCA